MKAKGKKIKAEEEPAPTRGTNVVDLMAALKKSIERPGATAAKGGGKSDGKPAAKKPAARKPAGKAAAPAKRKAARG
jgi:DNA end-binding protein Ku